MKKVLTSALIVCCFVAFIISIASCEKRPKTQAEILKDIETVIELFYENKDLGAENDFSKTVDENTLERLAGRLAAYRDAIAPHKFSKENYNLELVLVETSEFDKQIEYKFQIIATYNYERSPEIDITVSDEVAVLYDNGKDKITGMSFLSSWTDIDR
jgi:hypothetical protein